MQKNLNDRLFGKHLNETDTYNVPPEDKNGNIQFSLPQLAAIYEVMKPLLNASELQDFNDMSPEEQEQYLTGFGANILEWKKAKEAANKPDNGEDQSDMPSQQPPNDGLDHWLPAKKKKSNSGQQQNQKGNPIFSDIQDELDEAEKDAQKAQQDAVESNNQSADSSNPQDIANNAKSIARSAQEIADAAQNAADQAQNAADAADENAQQSGVSKDIRNADKSQVSADAAQDMADQAQAAANRAKQLAEEAQEAADNGDSLQAARKAKEAFDAAQEASNKTRAAQINAKDALRSSKQTDPNAGQESTDQQGQGQQGGSQSKQAGSNQQNRGDESGEGENGGSDMSGQQSGQQQGGQQDDEGEGDFDEDTDPTLQKVNNKFDQHGELIHKKPVNLDMPFDGNDFVANDKEMVEKCREMAERAGQPLDSDDYITPQEYATQKFQETRQALKKWQQHSQPGSFGNSPYYLPEVMDKLFATEFDWRELVHDFMTDKSPEDVIDVWSKRRMGLPDTHPFHRGRYLHPYEDFEEKRSGIAQVFFLVDASGSMGVTAGDGINIFNHIMSELIQIEMDVKIKRSAYATFNAGHIYRDDIFTWTYQDAMDEESLMEEFHLPNAGGGTSAVEGIKSIQDYDDVYSTNDPWTLLIVVTDGGDYYSGLKDICKDPEQVEHMLWVITATGKEWFDAKIKELGEQGIPEDHIVCVDINKEWGVDEDMIKNSKR